MSKIIENDHLFTASEIAYLEDRNRYSLVEKNRRDFGPGGPREHEKPMDPEEVVLQLDQDIFTYVVNLTVAQLQSELRKVGLSTKGDEQELKVRLAEHLQENRDKHGRKT
jgi:SAP domain